MTTVIAIILPASLIIALTLLTLWNPLILDCDETFNYLEPIYSFLSRGHALQTWEWSPEYALRPYIYPLLHVVPALVSGWLQKGLALYLPVGWAPSTLGIVKAMLGAMAFGIDWRLLLGASEVLFDDDGSGRRLLFLVIGGIGMALSPGQWAAGTAVLPNSLSKMLSSLAVDYWIKGRDHPTLLLVAASTIVGWSYVPILFYPFALVSMRPVRLGHLVRRLLVGGIVSGVYLLGPTIIVDRIFYGRWTVSPLNTLLYNLASTSRPALYGVEAWDWYLRNLVLNFNLLLPLALAALPLGVRQGKGRESAAFRKRRIISVLSFTILSGLVIFSAQPHKEERFLYPIFPLIVVCGVWALLQWSRVMIAFVTFGAFVILSASRLAALILYYRGTIGLFDQMPFQELLLRAVETRPSPLVICMGDSWYRFPSHFSLPPDARVGFLERPGNQALLPHYFPPDRRTIPYGHFNPHNIPSPTQYVNNLGDCAVLVGLEREIRDILKDHKTIPSEIDEKDDVCDRIIDPQSTPIPHRWLYLPVFGRFGVRYERYCAKRLLKFNK